MSNISIEEIENQIRILEGTAVQGESSAFTLKALRELIIARLRISELEKQLSVPVCLPACSSSPVCEIEAGYANGVNDSKEAIRRAGYPIVGDI